METSKRLLQGPQFLLSTSLLILIIATISCSSNSSSKKRQESDNTSPKIHEGINVLDLECKEIACFIPVDSNIARSLVPMEHKPHIEAGKAQILFLAQNCHTAIWDEQDISPLRKVHIWIRINGGDTISPILGVEETLPTYYWWD